MTCWLLFSCEFAILLNGGNLMHDFMNCLSQDCYQSLWNSITLHDFSCVQIKHMTFTGRNTNHSFSKSYQLFMTITWCFRNQLNSMMISQKRVFSNCDMSSLTLKPSYFHENITYFHENTTYLCPTWQHATWSFWCWSGAGAGKTLMLIVCLVSRLPKSTPFSK